MKKHEHLYENISVTSLPNAEVEITGAIPESAQKKLRAQTLRQLLSPLELPGFRKGNVPEAVFIERFGEMAVLEEIASTALQESYPHIILEQKVNVLGSPHISITKLAVGNPIEFKIKTAVYPDVPLPDYKDIARIENKKPADDVATDAEVKDTIRNIRKSKIPRETAVTKDEADIEKHLPEYTDAFVQSLGSFTNITDFEQKMRENIGQEKQRRAKEKKRAAILDTLATSSAFDVPQILVESELNKMFAQFEGDIRRMGATLEQYLSHIKKTREDMIADWKPDAAKRAKLESILHEIAEKEKLAPIEEDVLNEITHLKQHHKDIDDDRIRYYVESMLEKEQVMKFLEEQK